MLGRKPLQAVDANYQPKDILNILRECERVKDSHVVSDGLVFHQAVQQLKRVISEAENNADIRYFLRKRE